MAERSYENFRPMQPGDKGWWYKDHSTKEYESKSKRWFINPQTKEVIPLRQYQNLQRGTTYTKYRKQQEKKGVQKKTYKPRKERKKEKSEQKQQTTYQPRISKVDRRRIKSISDSEAAKERSEYLKEAWARKRSEEYGYPLDFDDLPDSDKTAFWQYYHEVVYQNEPPSQEEWDDLYSELFDMEYEDWYDIQYGETP